MPSLKLKELHPQGFTDVAYSPDGAHIVTCGADGLLQVLLASDLSTVQTVTAGKDSINAVAFSADGATLACGSEDRAVTLFKFPECTLIKTLARFDLPIRHVDFSPSGLFLAVGTDDSSVFLVNLIDTAQVSVLKGHSSAVVTVAWDPLGEFLATASADGTVKVWNHKLAVARGEASAAVADAACVHTAMAPVSDADGELDDAMLCRIAWHPKDGRYLAVPSNESGRCVDVLNRHDAAGWTTAYSLPRSHGRAVDSLAWSPNGRYMITAGGDQQVLLWDTNSHEDIMRYSGSALPAGLAWSPIANAFCFVDRDGKYAVVNAPVPAHLPSAVDAIVAVKAEEEAASAKAATEPSPAAAAAAAMAAADDDDTAEGAAAAGENDDTSPVRKKSGKRRLRPAVAKQRDSVESVRASLGLSRDGDDSDEHDVDDESDLLDAMLARGHGVSPGNAVGGAATAPVAAIGSGISAAMLEAMLGAHAAPMQPSFQSGATPLINSRRFLAWNTVGSIISRDENEFNSVEIEFADSSTNRTVRMSDHYKFNKGALSMHGAIFASAAREERGEAPIPSTVFFKPFKSWDHNTDWLAALPAGEHAAAVAVGRTWAAVAVRGGAVNPAADRALKSADLKRAQKRRRKEKRTAIAEHEARVEAVGNDDAASALDAQRVEVEALGGGQWVRVFRHSGVQEAVFSVPGPIVTVAGKGSLLAVVYHRAAPWHGSQQVRVCVCVVVGGARFHLPLALPTPLRCAASSSPSPLSSTLSPSFLQLAYTMFSIKPQVQDLSRGANVQMLCKGDFPLGGGFTLTYLGFSDRGQLIAQDSSGLIQGLHRQRSPRSMLAFWTPLMHTDRLWTVGISKGRVMGVVCKGESRYPSTLPRPVLTALPMVLPLINTATPQGRLEEGVVRQAMVMSQRGFKDAADLVAGETEATERAKQAETLTSIDKGNLRLMQIAIKKDRSARALDVAARLVHSKSLDIAVKLAQQANLQELAQRLDILRRAHQCILSDDEEEEEEEEDDSEDEEGSEGEQAYNKASAKTLGSKKRGGKKGSSKKGSRKKSGSSSSKKKSPAKKKASAKRKRGGAPLEKSPFAAPHDGEDEMELPSTCASQNAEEAAPTTGKKKKKKPTSAKKRAREEETPKIAAFFSQGSTKEAAEAKEGDGDSPEAMGTGSPLKAGLTKGRPSNPFMVKTVASPAPNKRRKAIDLEEDAKVVESPMLSRQSSFSITARKEVTN